MLPRHRNVFRGEVPPVVSRENQTGSALSAGVCCASAAGGTRCPLQASLSTCHSENHLIPVDSNPGSGDYCGTRTTAKLAYLSAAVDSRRLITVNMWSGRLCRQQYGTDSLSALWLHSMYCCQWSDM